MKQTVPDIIFVQEMKWSVQKIQEIHSKWLNRYEFIEFKVENPVGGILILSNPPKIGIIDAEASWNYLSVVIQPVGDRDTYLLYSTLQCFSEKMKLVDIETNIGLCTWNNKTGGDSQVASKLDRFIISEELMLLDKEIIADILPYGGLDHWSIQMEIKPISTPRKKPFRFENIWLSHWDFIRNIGKWWPKYLQIQGSCMFILHKRLKHITKS